MVCDTITEDEIMHVKLVQIAFARNFARLILKNENCRKKDNWAPFIC